jgi:hypothetical protein
MSRPSILDIMDAPVRAVLRNPRPPAIARANSTTRARGPYRAARRQQRRV